MSAGVPRMAVVVALFGLTPMAATAQNQPPGDVTSDRPTPEALHPSGLDDPWLAVEPEFPDQESRILRRNPTGGVSPMLAAKSEPGQRPWLRTMGALAGVVGLIVLLAWGYRTMARGNLPLLGKTRRPELIEVISRTPLSARQSVCLVRIGPRLVLVGQSSDTLRTLDVIADPDLAARLVGQATQRRPDSSQAEFRNCLEHEAAAYRQPDDAIDETITPDHQRIANVHQGVTSTIQRIRQAVAGM